MSNEKVYNMEMKNKIWFKRKKYGFGWYPVSWQGWLTILIWVILFVFTISYFDHEWLKNLIIVFILTSLLIYISYKKGEKPGWRWGDKDI